MFNKIDYEKIKSEAMYCMHCGLCRQVLPSEIKSDQFGELCPSGDRFRFEAYYAPGRCEVARAVIGKEFAYEASPKLLHVMYTCTTCGACDITCRYTTSFGKVQPVEIIEALRAKLVEDGVGPLPKQKEWGLSIDTNNNPYFESHANRLNWLGSKSSAQNSDIQYFVGCTSAYRTQDIASATYDILNKAGMDVMISPEEYCCGSPLFRTGQLDLAERVMNHNIEFIKESGIKKVVFSCAGCYSTFKKDYSKYYGPLDFEIKHISQVLMDLIETRAIELKDLNLKVTYHDPCHLGRHCYPEPLYEEPRKVLTAIPSLQFEEMERNRDETWCCGAGGGVKSAFPEFALSIAKKRLEEAAKNGAQAVISACPFCWNNFKDAVKADNLEVQIYDLTQIIKMAMEKEEVSK